MEALDHMDELLKVLFGAGHRSNTGDGSNQVEQASNKDDADIEGLKQNVSFRPDEEEGGDEGVRVVDEWTANDASGSSASEIVVEVAPEAPEAELELCLEHYFRDHFTLSTPSTLVRFRPARTASRVFEDKTSQFILEESIEEVTLRRRIQVKQLSDGTSGLQFLRLLYTVMCVFWTGIFFVLCLQILLVMVLEMAIHVGTTGINDGKVDPARVIGILLGICVFVYGFSQGLVIAGAFVGDAWTGHYLIKLFFFNNRYGNVLVDWLFFCFFVLFPLLVMCITLLMKQDEWWTITLLFWYATISVFFVIFAINCVYFEVKGALSFLSKRQDMIGKGFWTRVKECLLLRQRASYSGCITHKYVARSMAIITNNTEGQLINEQDSILEWSRQERTGPWARITKLSFLSTASQSRYSVPLFSPLEPPQPLHTIDDVQDNRPYVTKNTWSLERLFCRPRNSRYVVIVGGPGALTEHQIRSSVICSVIGMIVFFLVLLSFLVYMELPGLSILGLMVLCALASIPLLKDLRRQVRVTRRIFQARKEDSLKQQSDSVTPVAAAAAAAATPSKRRRQSRRESEMSDEPNEGLFLVAQQERINQASDLLCWIATGLEISFLYIFPLGVLFYVRNFPLAFLFIIVATVSFIRHYVNLLSVVEEVGQLSLISGATNKIRWSKQSRLNDLIGAISYNKTRKLWQLILAGCGIVWLAIFFVASQQGWEPSSQKSLTFVDGYAWKPQPDDVRYGTCDLSKSITFGVNATLADFAFLSGLAYKTNETAKSQLEGWFNNSGEVVEEDLITVSEYRRRKGNQNSPVFFRLFRFKSDNVDGKDRGVVSIRGTQTSWDLLADLQLWSAAMLAQGLRLILPIGELWTPILSDIVAMISFVQSGSVEAVSFYKVTTPFVEELKNDPTFDSNNIQLTGHSLGGGLAMISSAQSEVPSVALSGPNAMISGQSFQPKVLPDALNKYTFNIVPDRDPVPRFDDLAQNYQRIRCNAAQNKFMGCHSFQRSLCEIVYTCGSQNRPAICNCVYEFNYPEPELVSQSQSQQNNDDGDADGVANPPSFEQVCKDNGYVPPANA